MFMIVMANHPRANHHHHQFSIQWRTLLNYIAICISPLLFAWVIAALFWIILIPLRPVSKVDITFVCTAPTNVWELQYSTHVHSSHVSNFSTLNIDVLGLSIDELLELQSHSTVVLTADLIEDSTNVLQVEEPELYEMRKIRLNIHLRFQYPDQCCPIEECREVFAHRTMSKLLKHRTQYLRLEMKDGFLGVMMLHLDRLLVDKNVNNENLNFSI